MWPVTDQRSHRSATFRSIPTGQIKSTSRPALSNSNQQPRRRIISLKTKQTKKRSKQQSFQKTWVPAERHRSLTTGQACEARSTVLGHACPGTPETINANVHSFFFFFFFFFCKSKCRRRKTEKQQQKRESC